MLLTPIISTIIGKIIQSISENLEISSFSILFSIVYLSLLILVSGFTVKLMRRKNDYEELEIFPGQLKKFIKAVKSFSSNSYVNSRILSKFSFNSGLFI